METKYHGHELRLVENVDAKIMNLDDVIPMFNRKELKELPLRTLILKSSENALPNIKCSCKRDCKTNSCSCFKAKRKCNSGCHLQNKSCTNHD